MVFTISIGSETYLKVAIIGAGISGLSCAYELKRYGIIPTIFEKKESLSQCVDFNTTTLKLFDRNISNPMRYLKKEYNLDVKPLNTLNQIEMISPNNKTVVKGNLGYIFNRGENKISLENQIKSNTNLSIIFNKHVEIDDIINEYDYIVVATGEINTAKRLSLWSPTYYAFSRIAIISGTFNPNSLKMWVNTEYTKSCFTFLLPHSTNKASLVLTVDNINQNELDYYWEKFIKGEKITNTIIKTSDVESCIGFVCPPKVNNIYFIGVAGGFIDSVLEFGMLNGIESGLFAAQSIAKDISFDKLIKPIIKDLKNKHEFRKSLNTFSNNDFDKLIKFLGLPIIKQLIYNNPLSKVTHGTLLAKMYNTFK